MNEINPVIYNIPLYTARAAREGLAKRAQQGAIVSVVAGSALILGVLFTALAAQYGMHPSFFAGLGSFSSIPSIVGLSVGSSLVIGGLIAVVIEKKVHAKLNKDLIKNINRNQKILSGQLLEEVAKRLYYAEEKKGKFYLLFVKNGKDIELRGYQTEKQFVKAQKALQKKGVLPAAEHFPPPIDPKASILTALPVKKKTGF